MNIGVIIGLCVMCLLVGFELGNWKEGAAVSKATKELTDMHCQNIALLVNKILNLRKDKKDGE
jgi:hypothetical protein